MDGFLHLIVTSPSGAGKTTMVRALLESLPQLVQSVSNTTRAPRPGEVDGRDYHFVDRARFDAMVAEGDLCEWAEVHGHRYGTSMSQVRLARETHRGVVFVIDVQGARQVKAAIPDAVAVFVLPPSWEVLEQRLRGRGTEREEVIARRLANAREEVAQYGLFDYLVVNDDLATAIDELKGIARATVAQRARRAQRAEALLRSG
jgi:guanylate kinase